MIESDREIRQCSLLNINISVDKTSRVNWKKDLARMIRENFASANIQKYRTIPSVKKKCGDSLLSCYYQCRCILHVSQLNITLGGLHHLTVKQTTKVGGGGG